MRRVKGDTLLDKVCNSDIHNLVNGELLLLRIERSQLRWFGYVSRMPQERLSKQALSVICNGRRPVGRSRPRWLIHIKDLAWNRLGLSFNTMKKVVGDLDKWRLNLELLPLQKMI